MPAPTVFDNALNLKECADELGRVSSKLLDFRLQNWATLSLIENLALEAQERDLDKKANQLIEQAVVVIGDNAKSAQIQIAEATQQAADFIQKLKKVENAIQVVASVITLGVAIMSGQSAAIFSAISSVKKAVEPKDDTKATGK
jgi:hypothetical protein